MFTLNCKGKLLVADNPLVMGIINATPDSFYEGSRFSDEGEMLSRAETMIAAGVDIIDIGGQSTRPGSKAVTAEEELKRVINAVEAIHKGFPEVVISVDTYYALVAREAIDAGAAMINDVSAGNMDKEMLATVAKLGVPYIAMHMKGAPATMQQHANYNNVTRDVFDFFIDKIDECKHTGIHDIIIDPGFGFSKTSIHNFELLKNLSVLGMLNVPVLIGVSRKSSVYKTLGISADEALNGTTVLNTIALLNGANILRVHDVKEAKEVVKLWEQIVGGSK